MKKLNARAAEFLSGKAIQEKLITFGLGTEGAGTPASAAKYIADDQAQWRAVAKELDIEPQ